MSHIAFAMSVLTSFALNRVSGIRDPLKSTEITDVMDEVPAAIMRFMSSVPYFRPYAISWKRWPENFSWDVVNVMA